MITSTLQESLEKLLVVTLLFLFSLVSDGANTGADTIDSDAPASGVVSLSTASIGANDHTYDVGYGAVAATCNITLTPTVSGCYSVSGVSKAMVSVEVAWSNGPSNDYIVVSTGGQSRTIVPGITTVTYPQPTAIVIQGTQNIVTPQVVAFEIALTGAASSSSVTAKFASSSSCQATQIYSLPAACPPTSCSGLGGTVYRDFNADGVQQPSETQLTQGLAGVSVTAFDCNGIKYGPVLTDQYGNYSFSDPNIKYPVRIEFSDPAGLDAETVYGANSKSSVQFISQASCAVNLGLANPSLYCQSNPTIFIPCYTYGDPLNLNPTPAVAATALSGNTDALVSFPYDESNTSATGMTSIAEAQVMGTVWGLGYNRVTKDLFVSATLHRHAGLGPLGVGGIYVTHTKSTSATTQNFIDVSTIGIDVGGALVPVNGAGGRGLSADKTKPSNDIAVFSLIGKVGIGGLEISEDGQKIWFVNLYDKNLYSIDISAYNASGTKPTSANVKSYPIPDPSCSGGSSRPWALHISSGKLYVGSVCDALTSKNKSDLRAYVYSFDPTTTAFSPVFDFPLTYPKGYGISPLNSPGQAGADSTGWYPWTDSFSDLIIPTSTVSYKSLVHPQPMLADIDIDVDGSMILGFGDRTGMQGGFNNASTDPADTQPYTVNPAAGDVLRAYYSDGSYTLENNGKAGPYTGTGVGNKQGPGSGEFYDDNYTSGGRYVHTELALGGLALKSGSGHVVGATIDPVTNIANSGGVKYWNNQTGVAEAADIVYTTGTDPGTFAKAAGLGEPELNCDLLQVIEIGNRVWTDTNKDGVQDACEPPIAGVEVDLYKGTTKIASTTTNASGEYYFSNKASLTTGTWSGTGADTTLLPNTAYSVVFGNGQFANNILTVNGSELKLTVANSTTTNANDVNDSDALVSTVAGITAPVISLTTGSTGYINHSFDAGFYPPLASLGDYTFIDANKDGIQDVGDTPIAGVKVTLYLNGVASATTVTNASGLYSFTGLTPGSSNSYVVGFTAPSGYTTTTPLSGTDKTTDSDADPITGKTQSVTLAPDENNPTLDAGFYLPTAGLGDYVFLDANKDGIQNTGDTPIAGVVVTLYTNGVASATTVTNASGLYSFTGLTPGSSNSYVVGFTAPAGMTATLANAGTDDTKDSDADPITGKTQSVTLAPNEFNPTLDAGFYTPAIPTAGLGDYVFLDANKDGIQNTGDTPIAGVLVTLYTNGVASATTVTNASGLYSFTGLTPGASNSYVVGFTAPAGLTATLANAGTDDTKDSDADVITGKTQSVTLAPGEFNPTLDAGFYTPTAGLGDYVFLDANKDGIQNTGDTPIAGVVVTLYTNGVASATTVTNASGLYSFTGLTPGSSNSYVVGFTAPTGMTATLANAGTDDTKDSDADPITDKTQSVTLAPGEFNPTLDAGFYIPSAGLGDYVFLDANKDGIQNTGDTPIAGVVVTLYTNGVASATTVTNASGLYSFTGLTPGTSNSYVVGFTAPTGLTATLANAGTDDTIDSDADVVTGKTQSVTLAPGEFNPTLDAGFYTPTAGLGDYVFLDANKDGIQNTGDTPIAGVVVTLYTNGVASATTVTNASGLYSFTGLTPGTSNSYVVGFTAPTGLTATLANAGTDDSLDSDADVVTGKTQSVTLAAGEFNPTLDAGFYTPKAKSPKLTITKQVDKSKAKLHDVLTYTLAVTNSGDGDATNILVTDSTSTGLTYVINSATNPAGTTFTQGTPISTWTIGTLTAGQSLSMTFQATADSSGILYNKAIVAGDTATVCTSIPVVMCAGDVYTFTLTAPAGRSSYQWFKDGVAISGQTTNVLEVTAPGTYSLAVDNTSGKCPDFSCCPFIIEEDSLPSFKAIAVPVTCTGSTTLANGQIVLSGFNGANTYQYSLGSSFNAAASLSGVAKVIPGDGLLVGNLGNPSVATAYTIRVYNASGCYKDVTVLLMPTVCGCPADVCVPFVIQQTKRAPRIGDPK